MAALPEEYRREPALALASGDDGLDHVREILRAAPEHLEPNGVLVVETGPIDDSVRYYLEHAVELDREARMRKLMGDMLP